MCLNFQYRPKKKSKSRSGKKSKPAPHHWTGDGFLDSLAFATATPEEQRAIAQVKKAKRPIDPRSHVFGNYVQVPRSRKGEDGIDTSRR